jgi:hypothetical protein
MRRFLLGLTAASFPTRVLTRTFALTIALIGPFAFVCAHGQLDDRAEDCWRRSTHARTHARTQRTHDPALHATCCFWKRLMQRR